MDQIEFHLGDCREIMRNLPEASIQTCITSPPYFGLRSYSLEPVLWGAADPACEHVWGDEIVRGGGSQLPGKFTVRAGRSNVEAQKQRGVSEGQFCQRCGCWKGCLGNEPTVDQFVANLVEVFREVRRVLRSDGLAFCNIGDSYARDHKKGQHKRGDSGKQAYVYDRGGGRANATILDPAGGLRAKSLCLVPQRLAIALAEDGWIVRNWLNWIKPNKLPESVRDRFTVDFEPILMLAKEESYFFDMFPVREPASYPERRIGRGGRYSDRAMFGKGDGTTPKGDADRDLATRQPRTSWVICTQPLRDAHYAPFPEALVERALLCSTSEFGACAACGAPYRRIVAKGEPLPEWQTACGADAQGEYHGTAQKDYAGAKAQDASATKARILAGMRSKRTVGWTPTCKNCRATDVIGVIRAVLEERVDDLPKVVPCVALDPFSGSGTTGLVAKKLGRRAILVDQNPEYVVMAKRRIGEEDDGEGTRS